MQEILVVYYSDYTYAVYTVNCMVRTRSQWPTSFRCVFRIKLKDKNNAQVCS